MAKEARTVLSVIVRRLPKEFESSIETSIRGIQQSAAAQPGFVSLDDRLSESGDCELVTIFAFDSYENLEKWERSPIRNDFVEEPDRHSQGPVTHSQFADVSLLSHPKANIRKIETVVILIVCILVLGAILRSVADFIFPGSFPSVGKNVLLVSVNVVLISYVFLPWSSILLTKLKARSHQANTK